MKKTTSTTAVALPQTVDALRNAIKSAIVSYQGSPVKNENKLNEALAAALNFANYDQLSALLKQASQSAVSEIAPYPISFDYDGEQYMIINGVRIEAALAHEGVVDYTVTDRQERVDDLYMWISEAQRDHYRDRSGDIDLMKKDLKTLESSKEEYVLEAYGTNGFVAGDLEPEAFNALCDEILEAAKEHYAEKVGSLSKTGKRFDHAMTYYSGDDVSELYEGELVLINEDFLEDDTLPVGMVASRYVSPIPEGFIAAYQGALGEYVPVYLREEFDEQSENNE